MDLSSLAELKHWDERNLWAMAECLFLILRPSRHGSKASMIPCGICRLSSGLFHSLDWRWRWGWFGMSLFFSSTRRRRTFGYERCVCVPTRPHRASWNRVKDGLTDQTSSCRSILLLCRFWKRLAHSTEEETSPMLDNACHSCRERRFPQWRISPKNFLLDVALQSSIVNGWKCHPCSFIPICSSLTLILVRIVPILHIASVSLSLLRHCHSLSRWYLRFSFWSIRMIQRLFRHRRSIGDDKSIEHRYQYRHHSPPVPRSIRCFDEEFLLDSSIGQSPFHQTNNDVRHRAVRHPTFEPMVKSLWPNVNERMMERWGTERGWRERGQRGCVADVKDTGRERRVAKQREEEEDKFYWSSKANLPHSHTDQIEDVHINICLLIPQFTLSTLFSSNQVTVVIETIHVERRMSSWTDRKRDMTGFSLCLCLSVANVPVVPPIIINVVVGFCSTIVHRISGLLCSLLINGQGRLTSESKERRRRRRRREINAMIEISRFNLAVLVSLLLPMKIPSS